MSDPLIHLLQEGLLLVVLLSAPPIAATLLVSAVSSLMQAMTQVQDEALTRVPRLVAAYASLAVATPWIGAQLLAFTRAVFDTIAVVG